MRGGASVSGLLARRVALLFLLLSVSGAALAQCSRGPTTASVTLPDFLAVYYTEFRSLSAEDAALFYGGVCVTAVGGEWTVLAESVRVDEISGDIRLSAPSPTLYLGEWRIEGELLEADAVRLSLAGAHLTGPDASGSTDLLEVDVLTGEMRFRRLQLAGAAFAVKGELAVLHGESLQLEGAAVTTCIGIEPVPYELLGGSASVNLVSREVRLDDGALRLGRLRMELQETVILSEEALADFEFPVKVESHAGGPTKPGAGLSVRLTGLPLAPAVGLTVGGTGLEKDHQKGAVALITLAAPVGEAAERTSAEATFGLEAGAGYLDLRVSKEVLPWLDAQFGVRSGAAPARAARHEGSGALRAKGTLTPAKGVVAEGSATVFAAVTAVTAGAMDPGAQVAGPRLGVAVDSRTTWRSGPVTLGLTAGAEATSYPHLFGSTVTPGASAWQWGVRLAPSVALSAPPYSASLRHEALFTNSGSPFGAAVDRLTPLQRLQGSARVGGSLGRLGPGEWSGSLGARLTYDFAGGQAAAGLKRLVVSAEGEYVAAPRRFGALVEAELAGLVSPVGRQGEVKVQLTASRSDWPLLYGDEEGAPAPRGTFEVGLLLAHPLGSGAAGLSALELSAAVPLAFETLELRPYAAVDFAGLLTDNTGLELSGYGLEATFITCCGSFSLGAASKRGEWEVSVGVDLERRPRVEP